MAKESGTTIVALKFEGGVIIASDKKASAGFINYDPRAQKIHKITDKILFGAAGLVGDIQFLVRILKANLELKSFKDKKEPSVGEASYLLANIMHSSKWFPYLTEVILVGKDSDNEYRIYSIDEAGGVSRFDDYISTGSGMMFALGTLEANYKKNMKKEEAIELAKKAVYSAIKRDLGSGEGIDIYVLTDQGIEEYHYKIEKDIIEQL